MDGEYLFAAEGNTVRNDNDTLDRRGPRPTLLRSFISSSVGDWTSSHHVFTSGPLACFGPMTDSRRLVDIRDSPDRSPKGSGGMLRGSGPLKPMLVPGRERFTPSGRSALSLIPANRSSNVWPSAGSSLRLRAWIVAESAFE